jgi:hypothetical protein
MILDHVVRVVSEVPTTTVMWLGYLLIVHCYIRQIITLNCTGRL